MRTLPSTFSRIAGTLLDKPLDASLAFEAALAVDPMMALMSTGLLTLKRRQFA